MSNTAFDPTYIANQRVRRQAPKIRFPEVKARANTAPQPLEVINRYHGFKHPENGNTLFELGAFPADPKSPPIAGQDRDNRGRVFLYCNPHDQVIGESPVQGIGWRGVSQAQLDALGADGVFHQRVWATPGGKQNPPFAVGAPSWTARAYRYIDDHHTPGQFWNPPAPRMKFELSLNPNQSVASKIITVLTAPIFLIFTRLLTLRINDDPKKDWAVPITAPVLREPLVPQARRYGTNGAFDEGSDPSRDALARADDANKLKDDAYGGAYQAAGQRCPQNRRGKSMKARNWIAPIAALCCALGWGAVALAGGNAATLETKTECFGYYNLRMPGGVEWPFTPAMRLTPDSVISTWFKGIDTPTRTRYFVDTGGIAVADDWGPDRIAISESATSTELKAVIANLHEKKDYEKKLLMDRYARLERDPKHEVDPDGSFRASTLREAAAIPYYIQIPIPQLEAYGLVEGKYLTFFVLYEGRILQTRRLSQGSPADTVQAFLSHIRPRAVYDVPGEPGSCLPALFVTGEKSPSRLTGTFRLRDMPEIGVMVSIYPAGPETKAETEDILKKAVGPLHPVKPFSRLRPLESVVADGNKGYGVYFYRESAVVTKSMPRPTTPDIDMAFIARIPGNPTLPKGKTFTLGIEINRYGLHAKEPMSEKEFRKIVTSIMQGITMRPGAWQELSP